MESVEKSIRGREQMLVVFPNKSFSDLFNRFEDQAHDYRIVKVSDEAWGVLMLQ